jgi:hypothetical protein
MSDRLALAHAIEDAGIPRDKAEGVATAIARFVEGNAATKADVERAEANLKVESAMVRTEITRLDGRIGWLDGRVDQVGSRTFNRVGALVVVVAGLLFAALHAWPPH